MVLRPNHPFYMATLRYPAKNDRFLAGERRLISYQKNKGLKITSKSSNLSQLWYFFELKQAGLLETINWLKQQSITVGFNYHLVGKLSVAPLLPIGNIMEYLGSMDIHSSIGFCRVFPVENHPCWAGRRACELWEEAGGMQERLGFNNCLTNIGDS